jgi:hypothetical protein
LQSVREIAFFVIHQDRVSEAINRSDEVPRYHVPPIDSAPDCLLDRFAFSLEIAGFGNADTGTVRLKELAYPLKSRPGASAAATVGL